MTMNNKQQIQNRIRRSKYRRRMKKKQFSEDYDNFDKIVTFKHFVESYKKSTKGVGWKDSVQTYSQKVITKIWDAVNIVETGVIPPLRNKKTIEICERGKHRTIFPVVIDDRVIQKVFCDYSLTPLVERTIIEANCASLKGKGVQYARDRITQMIRSARNEYGNVFYVLVFDFKSYFDSIPHRTCEYVLNKLYSDKRIVNMLMQIIRSYHIPEIERIKNKSVRDLEMKKLLNNERCGICLGSQVSQLLALLVPNSIDHLIKDKFGIKHYIRYMDDGIIIAKDKETLNNLFEAMENEAEKLGLKFSQAKTYTVKSTKGFTFLKVRYWIGNDGRVHKKLFRSGITRMRRKLKKFKKKTDNGTMTLKNVYDSMQSWLEHSKVADSYHTKNSMLRLYKKLFGKFHTVKGGIRYDIL